MAGKNFPKVDDIVEIVWRDSGVSAARSGFEPSELSTLTLTNYGKVKHVSEDDIILATSWSDDGGPTNCELWGIWKKAVISWKRLK